MKLARIESAVRVALGFAEAFNRRDVASVTQLLADDCVLETAGPAPDGAVYSGKAAVTEYWQEFFRRTRQAHLKVEDVFGFGLRCVMRWRCDWVTTAGEHGHARGVDVFQVRENLICEHRSYVKGPLGAE